MTEIVKAEKPLRFLYSALDNYGGYPFADLFDAVKPVYLPDDMKAANACLVIWGGGDISPSMYGQQPCSRTGATVKLSSRDQMELTLASHAMKMGMPIIGICRGAQMMCALAGGKLVQDVTGHGGNHTCRTDEGKIVTTTSLHHQMMYPWDVDHKLIAWCEPPRSKEYIEGVALGKEEDGVDVSLVFPETVDPFKREPEIVYFPTVKCLAIQGHPEFIHNDQHHFVIYCKKLVKKYLIESFLK